MDCGKISLPQGASYPPINSYHVNYLSLAVKVFHFAILRCFLGGIITLGKELVYEFVIGAEHSAPLEREPIP
jgi:hypothetical protein